METTEKENQRLNSLLDDMLVAVQTQDQPQLQIYHHLLTGEVNLLSKETMIRELQWALEIMWNQIFPSDWFVGEELEEHSLEALKFERQVLLQFKKYLKDSKKRKQYDQLPFSYSILVSIMVLHNQTMEYYSIWKNGINGIAYDPGVSFGDEEELKKTIAWGVKQLKINNH